MADSSAPERTPAPRSQTPRLLARICSLLLVAGIAACGSGMRTVPKGPHPSSAPSARVDDPPPPVRVEIVPLARSAGCAWLDGHYERVGRTWRWRKGSWVRAPRGCYYAPPSTRYEEIKQGVFLIHRPGAWYPKKEGGSCAVVEACENASDRPEASEAADSQTL